MSQIELHHDAAQHASESTHMLLQPQLEEIFQSIVERHVRVSSLSIETVFENHFQEPKAFGAANKHRLLFDTMTSLAFTRNTQTPKKFKVDAFELSASMLWETAFIETVESHNSLATADSRLELVDMGSALLKHASTLTQRDDMEKTQRLLVRSLFSQVMRDIAAGEVTIATRNELLMSLLDAKSQLKFIKDKARGNGLLGEIETLEFFWKEYHETGNKVAIPSTVRGGSGHFNKEETHDTEILRQRRDESWIVLTPVEVKRQGITDTMRERYTKSHLASVATDGTVSFSGEHRQIAR